MKEISMRSLRIGFTLLALASLTVLLPACGTESLNTASETAAAKSSVDSLWISYAEAADRRDAVGFGSLFAEDGVLLFAPGPTMRGRAEIEKCLVDRYTAIDARAIRIVQEDLRAGGSVAYQGGTFEEDFTEGGTEKTAYGRFAAMLERGDDGVWRFRRLVAMADSTR
jgi:uncharacterized protein (TIGR02246 family)